MLSNTLVSGASDSDPSIRQIVTEGLARVGTADAAEVLRRLASQDSFRIHDSGAARYPVREAAVKALKSISPGQ